MQYEQTLLKSTQWNKAFLCKEMDGFDDKIRLYHIR